MHGTGEGLAVEPACIWVDQCYESVVGVHDSWSRVSYHFDARDGPQRIDQDAGGLLPVFDELVHGLDLRQRQG